MLKEIISTEKSPKAIGPYSQAVRFNGLVFVSGQIPIEPESGEISKEISRNKLSKCLKI